MGGDPNGFRPRLFCRPCGAAFDLWTLADLDELIDRLLPLKDELHFLVKRLVEIHGG